MKEKVDNKNCPYCHYDNIAAFAVKYTTSNHPVEEYIPVNFCPKCGATSYPVVGIGSSENDKPVIWCKSDVGDEWNIIVPEKDENGQYHRFCVPNTRACKLVDVKYFYKKEVGDYWLMGKRQIERGQKEH